MSSIQHAVNYQNLLSLCQKYIAHPNLLGNFLKLYLIFLKASFQHSHQPTSLPDYLQHNYIFHDCKYIRTIFNNFYYLLSDYFPSLKQEYYGIKISTSNRCSLYEVQYRDRESVNILYVEHCSEYFDVLNKLLLRESSEQE